MNATSVWLVAGWTMLHFLWVGGAIGVIAAVVRRTVRTAPAEVRYAMALSSLAVLALAPAAIGWRLCLADRAERLTPAPNRPAAVSAAITRQDGEESRGLIDRDDSFVQADRAAAPTVGIDRSAAPRPPWLVSRLDALAAWLPWLWLAGSPLTFAWLALGLAGAERLRRRSLMLTDGELPRLCRRLAEELGILRGVAVAVCDRLAVPVLVGVVRPLILLPAAALGAWDPDQLEMVLLHELAHVRRWDNLVNLIQRLIESVLFFHPAVWIVSGWVRLEREHCCDAIVVARTGRARAYAETLLALADELPAPLFAVSTSLAPRHNHLVERIRHILTPREEHPMKVSRSLIFAAAAAIVAPAFWIAAMAQSQPPRNDQTNQKAATVNAKEVKAGEPGVMIQGKPLADWIAALKDRDPAVRKQALAVLGDLTREQAGDQHWKLLGHVSTAASMDKDPGVREAAAAAQTLLLPLPPLNPDGEWLNSGIVASLPR